MKPADGLEVLIDEEAQQVVKPWGREIWLVPPEHNGQYVFKILEIKQGFVTSLQYHNEKIETMYFLEGQGILHYRETHDGPTLTMPVGPGTVINVRPKAVHRIEAVTDIRYVEAQTPQVHDVIRLEDSYGRSS